MAALRAPKSTSGSLLVQGPNLWLSSWGGAEIIKHNVGEVKTKLSDIWQTLSLMSPGCVSSRSTAMSESRLLTRLTLLPAQSGNWRQRLCFLSAPSTAAGFLLLPMTQQSLITEAVTTQSHHCLIFNQRGVLTWSWLRSQGFSYLCVQEEN